MAKVSGGIMRWTGTSPCGTRGAYTRGCRCDPCRASNAKRYRDRAAEARARVDEVTPTGPPIPATMVRAGVAYSITRCPGANGSPCLIPGGTWLKKRAVCLVCVKRIVMWDGLVPVARARAHVLMLSKKGVGRDQVADACGLSTTRIQEIRQGTGAQRIRAQAERRLLAVDESVRADGMPVRSGPTKKLIAKLIRRGFRRYELARLLGYAPDAPALQMKGPRVLLSTAAKVEKLFARVERGEVAPAPARPKSIAGLGASIDELQELRDRGVELARGEGLELELRALRELRQMRRAS